MTAARRYRLAACVNYLAGLTFILVAALAGNAVFLLATGVSFLTGTVFLGKFRALVRDR